MVWNSPLGRQHTSARQDGRPHPRLPVPPPRLHSHHAGLVEFGAPQGAHLAHDHQHAGGSGGLHRGNVGGEHGGPVRGHDHLLQWHVRRQLAHAGSMRQRVRPDAREEVGRPGYIPVMAASAAFSVATFGIA